MPIAKATGSKQRVLNIIHSSCLQSVVVPRQANGNLIMLKEDIAAQPRDGQGAQIREQTSHGWVIDSRPHAKRIWK